MAGAPFDEPPRYGLAYDQFGGGEAGKGKLVAAFTWLRKAAQHPLLTRHRLHAGFTQARAPRAS